MNMDEVRYIKLEVPYMRGDDVLTLQRMLIACGYPVGGADGIFGPKTLAALTAFQQAAGLETDGVAGPETLAALGKCEAGLTPDKGRVARFIAWLNAQTGQIYVWGAQGHVVPDEAWIRRMETSTANAERAIRLYEKRVQEGRSPILAYDCSGLIMRWLLDEGVFKYDMSAKGLYSKCAPLTRDALQSGDLVFRYNNVKIIHVGVYVGGGNVIESKGRDVGVVLRDINASGTAYWNRYGRLTALEE